MAWTDDQKRAIDARGEGFLSLRQRAVERQLYWWLEF